MENFRRSSVFCRQIFYLTRFLYTVSFHGCYLAIYRKCEQLLRFLLKSLIIIFLLGHDHMYAETARTFKFSQRIMSSSLSPWYQESESIERIRLTFICTCLRVHTRAMYRCTKPTRDALAVKYPMNGSDNVSGLRQNLHEYIHIFPAWLRVLTFAQEKSLWEGGEGKR